MCECLLGCNITRTTCASWWCRWWWWLWWLWRSWQKKFSIFYYLNAQYKNMQRKILWLLFVFAVWPPQFDIEIPCCDNNFSQPTCMFLSLTKVRDCLKSSIFLNVKKALKQFKFHISKCNMQNFLYHIFFIIVNILPCNLSRKPFIIFITSAFEPQQG